MPQPYYTFPDTSYPNVLLAVIAGVKKHISDLLYPDEEYAESLNRFVITTFDTGEQLRQSVNINDLSNGTFPFTAYSIGDWKLEEEKSNWRGASKTYYSSYLNAKIHAVPTEVEIEMVTFFTTNLDFFRAKEIFFQADSTKTLLKVPVTINSVVTSIPVLVEYEVSKGTYQGDFREQLNAGNLSDIVHNLTLNFYNYVIDGVGLKPIEDIKIFMYEYDKYNKGEGLEYGSLSIPDPPTITETTPIDEGDDIPVEISIIVTFDLAMNEESVEDSITIYPPINYHTAWDSESKVLGISPDSNLDTSTEYIITIENTAKSGDLINMEENYEFSFTTED